MIRKSWWAALALTAAVGCGESNPEKVNNELPQTKNAGAGVTGGGQQGGGGAAPAVLSGAAPDAAPGTNPYGAAGYPQTKRPDAAGGAAAKDAAKPDDAKKEGEEPKKESDKADAPKTAAVELSGEELAEIKKLPEADQALALAQKVCLVGEEDGKPNHLGSMGVPVKKVVNGKTVFLCCKGCTGDLEKDPAKYLAKLNK